MIEISPLGGYRGVDCRHLSVMSILKYKEYEKFESVWKQCGIYYEKSEGQELGNLKGCYLNVKEELALVNKIDFSSVYNTSKTKFLDAVDRQLQNNEPTIVFADTFNFIGNMYFQSKSMYHTITIIGKKNNEYYYIDDTFFTSGKLSRDELLLAGIINENQYNHLMLTGDKIQFQDKEFTLNDFFEVISINKRYMLGKDLDKKEIDILSRKRKNYKITPGLIAIKEFIRDYENILRSKEIDYSETDRVYRALLELSNCHYRFSAFLRYGENLRDFSELINYLEEVGQEWKIAGNMMVKSMFRNDKIMNYRMIEKVKDIYLKEEIIINLLDKELKNIMECEKI